MCTICKIECHWRRGQWSGYIGNGTAWMVSGAIGCTFMAPGWNHYSNAFKLDLNLEVQQKTRRSALDIVSYYYFFNPVQRLLTQLELQYRNNGLANYVARVLNVRSYNRILQWKRRALGVKGKLHTFDVFNCKSWSTGKKQENKR